MEQKILNFLKDKKDFVKLNDFLKSLYGLPKDNEPPAWSRQNEMKRLRLVLSNLVQNGEISMENERWRDLGKFYYPDDKTGVTHYYNIGNLDIKAKIL